MMIAYSNSMLSDALERDYSNNIYQGNRPVSLKQGFLKVAAVVVSAAKVCSRFMADAINAQAEARARDMGYSNLLRKDF